LKLSVSFFIHTWYTIKTVIFQLSTPPIPNPLTYSIRGIYCEYIS
jgi:hypothetical protein